MSRNFSKAIEANPSEYPNAGKRRVAKRVGRRPGAMSSQHLLRLPPTAVLAGLTAIAVATGGAITSEPVQLLNGGAVSTSAAAPHANDSALSRRRTAVVSRSAPRQEAEPGRDVEAAQKRREQALDQIEAAAERRE